MYYVFVIACPCRRIVLNTCIGGSSVFEIVSPAGQRYNSMYGFHMTQIRGTKKGGRDKDHKGRSQRMKILNKLFRVKCQF
jgi:hypothetical protein